MTPEGKVKKYLFALVKATGGKARNLRWIGRRRAVQRARDIFRHAVTG